MKNIIILLNPTWITIILYWPNDEFYNFHVFLSHYIFNMQMDFDFSFFKLFF
jgi:hypothetical protein